MNYTYDAAGNVTNDGVHSYGYDSENRIVSVDGGSTASYAYDYQNQRYKKTVGSTVTHYVWEDAQVMAEHNGSTGAVLVDYVYSGERMIAKVASGTTQYFLSDRLSARLVLDTSGNVIGRMAHLPFGNDFGESGTQEKHHFTSYERDAESGTDYGVNRQYVQGIGRFDRVDSLASSASKDSPQSWNRYSYVQNDPVNGTDPTGLERCNVEIRAGGARVKGAYLNPNYGRTTGVITGEFLSKGDFVYLFEVIISTYDQTERLTYWYAAADWEFSLIYKHKKKASTIINEGAQDVPDFYNQVQWYQTRSSIFLPTDFHTYLYIPIVVKAKPGDGPDFKKY